MLAQSVIECTPRPKSCPGLGTETPLACLRLLATSPVRVHPVFEVPGGHWIWIKAAEAAWHCASQLEVCAQLQGSAFSCAKICVKIFTTMESFSHSKSYSLLLKLLQLWSAGLACITAVRVVYTYGHLSVLVSSFWHTLEATDAFTIAACW